MRMRPYDTLPRRPNGRPQACDPCRRRKVACGHGQPVCIGAPSGTSSATAPTSTLPVTARGRLVLGGLQRRAGPHPRARRKRLPAGPAAICP